MVLLFVAVTFVLMLYLGIVVRTSWVLTRPKRGFVPWNYAPSGIPFEKVVFLSRDNVELAGWHAHKQGAPGTIIFSHGVWANHLEMESRAKEMWERGFSVFLFDYRACGESAGTTTTLGAKEIYDLLGAVDYLLDHNRPSAVGVWGNSMGGAVAIMASARCPQINAIVSDSAFAALADNVTYGFHAATGLPARPFMSLVIRLAQMMSGTKINSIRPVDIVSAFSPRPLFIIQGVQDELVLPNQAHALYTAAKEPKKLWIITDCGHVEGFNDRTKEFADRVEMFFLDAFSNISRV